MVDGQGLQPGNFQGEPDVFVLRDILQYSATREEAEAYVNSVNRTWAIFIGVGDFSSQKLDIIWYKQESAVAYTDVTMPSVTEQPYIESVCYVDSHPQPSWEEPSSEHYLPTALQDFYGIFSIHYICIIFAYVYILMYFWFNNQEKSMQKIQNRYFNITIRVMYTLQYLISGRKKCM